MNFFFLFTFVLADAVTGSLICKWKDPVALLGQLLVSKQSQHFFTSFLIRDLLCRYLFSDSQFLSRSDLVSALDELSTVSK